MKYSEKTLFTLLTYREFPANGRRAPGLKSSRTQIETVADKEQRHGQAASTKNKNGFESSDINLSSKPAGKHSCDGRHLRSPELDENEHLFSIIRNVPLAAGLAKSLSRR